MFLLKILAATLLTRIGSLWIDHLYSKSADLSFPNQILSRSNFRKPILFVSLAFFFNLTNNFWIMSAIFLLALMTITDFEQFMLFDAMTLPFALLGAIFSWNRDFTDALAASILFGGIFLLLAAISKGALGGGDVKLIFALGFWLGTENLLNVVLIGTILGGIAALILILAKKKDRGSYFAYGPYFSLTSIYFLLVGA